MPVVPLPVSSDADAVRLAKRVAAQRGCSRAEAERLIVSGAVQVDGVVLDQPQARVLPQQTVVVGDALALTSDGPQSVIWFKPVGVALPDAKALGVAWLRAQLSDAMAVSATTAPSGPVFHAVGPRWHVLAPITAGDSGLVLLSQHPALVRVVAERAALLEQEWLIDLPSAASADHKAQVIRSLQAPLSHNGRPLPPARASWHSDTRVRLAIKGAVAGQAAFLAQRAGVAAAVLRRQRLGRLSLSGLLPGQWRTLMPTERV